MLSCLPVLTSVLFPTRLFCLSLGFSGLWLCRGDSRLAGVVPSSRVLRRARRRARWGAPLGSVLGGGLPPETQQLVSAGWSPQAGGRRDPPAFCGSCSRGSWKDWLALPPCSVSQAVGYGSSRFLFHRFIQA